MHLYKYFKRYTKQFLRNTFIKNNIQFLIFFVTARCNCRCGICFYWQELNKADELSFDEIKAISKSIGRVHTVLLSGGEPFLRNDLLEVCQLLIEQNKLSILSVPTNGTLPEAVAEFSEKILRKYPHLTLSIAVSLDGFRQTHDRIRGVNGIFDKATETLKELARLKCAYNNLEIVVNTVITNQNIAELTSFMDFVYEDFNVDYHEFELLRGEYKDKDFRLAPLDDIKYIHRRITKNRERYLERDRANPLDKLAIIGLLLFNQKMKERFLAKKRNPFMCSAGKNIGVIDAHGDIRLCELLAPVGNLRNAGYDFGTVWNSIQANELRNTIINKHCSCTHVCFIKLSGSSSFKTLLYILYYYLIYKIKNERV